MGSRGDSMSKELDLQDKYEEEFIEYMYSNSDFHIYNGDSLLRYLEDGTYFDEWLKEYHYDEWKKDNDEWNARMQARIRSKEEEKELDEIDRQMVRASGKVYDPPMSDTEQYLLNKEREEEHKSYDY
jgi:hypothetical protein